MDLIPKKIIIISVIFSIVLVVLLNYGLKHHDDHEAIVQRFDIYQVKELFKLHVTIAHKDRVEEKLKKLKSDGVKQLQVILDFDKTLSKFRDKRGNKIKSTHDLFSDIETVNKTYRDGSARLYSLYGPIESDPSISIEDKIPFMELWVDEYEELVKDIPMNSSLIEKAVKKNNLVLRDGVKKMFKDLQESSIPVLIFSAGLGDVAKAVLHVQNINMPNIHIISNFFTYDKGKISGFKGRHIHAFNKDQRILEEIDFRYAKELKGRSNVILVGDSLGDTTMADGLPWSSTILRIGFLNNKVQHYLPYYKEKFDIVTANDETMNITNAVLRQILYN